MKSLRWIFLLGLLLALHPFLFSGALSEGAPSVTKVENTAPIPAEVRGNTLFVTVMINGRGPFRVMVDTGCSITIVSPKLAEAVGAFVQVTESDPMVAQNGFGNQVNVGQVMFHTVQLGGVRFEGVMAAVSDTFEKISEIEGKRIDGALGYPLFADLFLCLDFPNKRLLLGTEWPVGMAKIQGTMPVVEHSDVPFVQLQLQEKLVQVMIDTGSNQALQLPLEEETTFTWKVKPRPGSLVAVFGETAREQIGRLDGQLSLGGVEQVEPTAVLSSGPPSIGVRSLKNFCVVFSQGENKVWLCGTTAGPIPPKAEKSIGLSLYFDAVGLRIAGVIPGSPAEEAKIAPGSVITEIEHRPAKAWTVDELQHWIETHASVALVVAEKAGERALSLKAWDLVP